MTGPAMLRLDNIHMAFGATRALRGVSLNVSAGRVHALLGGNGSGKSTIVKILAGVHRADAGKIEVDGVSHDASSFAPTIGRDVGLRFVHQDLGLFPDMTVADNLAFGRSLGLSWFSPINRKNSRAAARTTLREFRIRVSPDTLMSELQPADRTLVAIARALGMASGRPKVLVLDEPTASLPEPDANRLLAHLDVYRSAGCAIIYISHRLNEVRAIADDVTVLRDGQVVASEPLSSLGHGELVDLLAGPQADTQPVTPESRRERSGDSRPGHVSVRGLSTSRLRRLDLDVRQGEVLGVTGLSGSGHEDVTRALFGAVVPRAGTMSLAGAPYSPRGPRDALEAGVVLSPADRHHEACFLDLPVRSNLSAPMVRTFARGGWLRLNLERRWATAVSTEYRIKSPTCESAIGALSGGNQQKVVLARWLGLKPRILLLEEPTQGVDIGARAQIHRHIADAAHGGAAVIVSSTDLDELVNTCDRVLVLTHGSVVSEQLVGDVSRTSLTRALQQAVAA